MSAAPLFSRYGCYTDDGQMLLALAASLVNKGQSNLEESTRHYVLAFDPRRGYGGSAVKAGLVLHGFTQLLGMPTGPVRMLHASYHCANNCNAGQV